MPSLQADWEVEGGKERENRNGNHIIVPIITITKKTTISVKSPEGQHNLKETSPFKLVHVAAHLIHENGCENK